MLREDRRSVLLHTNTPAGVVYDGDVMEDEAAGSERAECDSAECVENNKTEGDGGESQAEAIQSRHGGQCEREGSRASKQNSRLEERRQKARDRRTHVQTVVQNEEDNGEIQMTKTEGEHSEQKWATAERNRSRQSMERRRRQLMRSNVSGHGERGHRWRRGRERGPQRR